MTDYTDGNWHAMTLGELISIMVDSGGDPAVLMRVAKDEPSKNGAFIRHLEITMIPQGRVSEVMRRVQPASVHKVLVALMEKDIVK